MRCPICPLPVILWEAPLDLRFSCDRGVCFSRSSHWVLDRPGRRHLRRAAGQLAALSTQSALGNPGRAGRRPRSAAAGSPRGILSLNNPGRAAGALGQARGASDDCGQLHHGGARRLGWRWRRQLRCRRDFGISGGLGRVVAPWSPWWRLGAWCHGRRRGGGRLRAREDSAGVCDRHPGVGRGGRAGRG